MEILVMFLILLGLMTILSALKVKESFCMKEELSITYDGKESCFKQGNYTNTKDIFPVKKQCQLQSGNNIVKVYADTDFNKHLYTLDPESVVDVPCKPWSFQVYT